MFLNVTLHLHTYISAYIVYHKSTKRARDGRVARVTTGRLLGSDTTTVSLLRQFRSPSIACPVRDFAFPNTNFVKALLAMLSALRLVAGCKHAPGTFGSTTWQAEVSSDQGIHKTKQNARKVN